MAVDTNLKDNNARVLFVNIVIETSGGKDKESCHLEKNDMAEWVHCSARTHFSKNMAAATTIKSPSGQTLGPAQTLKRK